MGGEAQWEAKYSFQSECSLTAGQSQWSKVWVVLILDFMSMGLFYHNKVRKDTLMRSRKALI